jgi:hypothetical protein
MIRTLRTDNCPVDSYERRGKAVLEHYLENHEFCGQWCPRTGKKAEELQATGRFYRCKTKDAALYKMLHGRCQGSFL